MKNPERRETAEMIESAMRLHGLGFSVIPLRPPSMAEPNSGKAPLVARWAEFQRLRADEALIERWWAKCPSANAAVVCGPVSGTVVVDADSDEAVDLVLRTLPETPVQVITSKGRHFYYRDPGVRIGNRARVGGQSLDVRGFGGYVVGAGSTHWTGHRYEWLEEPTREMLKEMPRFDPAWIEEPRKHGEAAVIVENDRMRLIRRAMRYVQTIPGAESGKGGHNVTMRVAGILVQRFGLTMEEAMPIMVLFNERCEPKWGDKDLLHKLQEAVRLKTTQAMKGN